jgi:hypothetical protein
MAPQLRCLRRSNLEPFRPFFFSAAQGAAIAGNSAQTRGGDGRKGGLALRALAVPAALERNVTLLPRHCRCAWDRATLQHSSSRMREDGSQTDDEALCDMHADSATHFTSPQP